MAKNYTSQSTLISEVTTVTIRQILKTHLGNQKVTAMVMNDLLPSPLFNVNQPSYSWDTAIQKLTMKILGQGHACGQKSRSHLT